jgi:hypothetical protein
LTRKAIFAADGRSCRRSPSRFGSNWFVNKVIPVAFPLGRLKVAANPSITDRRQTNTIGIVEVAAFAAKAAFSPPVVVRTRRTSSAAIGATRSYSPTAYLYSIATF